MDFTTMFSKSTIGLKSSKIRELFKMANIPGIISMAGGMPDSESFPFEEIKNIINSWNYGKAKIALQYGTTKGYPLLLEEIKNWVKEKKKISMEGQDVLITTGSQQGLSLISKVFLDPDDVVLVEIPSFIGAIASFYSFMGRIEGVVIDDQGMDIDDLVKKLEECKAGGKRVKFLYSIPNFNNPSGITLSQERRRKILEVTSAYGIPVVEDDPYGELYYDGNEEDYRPIKSLDPGGDTIYLGTFSKVLSPGIRVGWILGCEELISKLELQKQSFDACTPTFSQVMAYDYMKRGYIDIYVSKMKKIYRERRDALIEALGSFMPEEVQWTKPSGGLFVWVTLPEWMDAEAVFKVAIKEKVAFVTGDAFLPDNHSNHYLRLCFSDLPIESIKKGIEILSGVIKRML